MTKKYQLCLGHIAPRNRQCPECIADDLNRICPDYKPIGIYKINIEEVDVSDIKIPVHSFHREIEDTTD